MMVWVSYRQMDNYHLVLAAERRTCFSCKSNRISIKSCTIEEEYIPSVSLALPPVGWHNTVAHAPHRTTVCACENTVVMA